MKIMRYYEIKSLGSVLPVNNGRFQLNPYFDITKCPGEIIILLGSLKSSQTWLQNLLFNSQNRIKQAIAGAFTTPYYLPEKFDAYKFLDPLKTLNEQIWQVVKTYQPQLISLQAKYLADKYLMAAGLKAYGHLTPLQVPGIAVKQAKLALRYATGHKVILLDNLFEDLDGPDKALLHISLLNLQDSEAIRRTVIYATQNLDDAMYMADRILIMNPIKIGTVAENLPVNLKRPRNRQELKKISAFKTLRRQLHYLLTDALALKDYFLLR
jgi:ABC-type nitrate/sulfonate/bicarbonate transport system ATPase subunit